MVDTQLLKGILEGCVLVIIARGETYGYEILSLLGDNGFCDLGEGTLYPLLARLNKNEYIFCRKAKSPLGPIRKYYTITLKGEDIEEFCKSYFEEEAEKTSKWIGGAKFIYNIAWWGVIAGLL